MRENQERAGDSRFTFQLEATEDFAQVTAIVESLERAREIAAQFPKSYGMRAKTLSGSGPDYTDADGRRITKGYLELHAKLAADGVNRGVNESGIARLRRTLSKIERLGYAFEYQTNWKNSISLARLEEKIGAALK